MFLPRVVMSLYPLRTRKHMRRNVLEIEPVAEKPAPVPASESDTKEPKRRKRV